MRGCGLECNRQPCMYEGNDVSWVKRRGGCAGVPLTRITTVEQQHKGRVGQQKQSKARKSKDAWYWKRGRKARRAGVVE